MQREHLAWVDLLRILACFLVIISHSCDAFVGQFDKNPTEFLTGAFIGSLVWSCVPLFVMLLGVLLLPANGDMATFYRKRAKRLLIPFIFWSLALPVLFYVYVHSGVKISNPTIVAADYTPQRTLQKMALFIFNFNFDTTALWYVYMLIGLYLVIPIISPWLRQASKQDLHWFLVLWGISMVVPYLQMLAPLLDYTGNFGKTGVLGVSLWNAFGTFYYFSGFLGYLILAYYLQQYPLTWSRSRTLIVALVLFLIDYAITAGGFILTQKHFPGSYANLEIIWYFYGVNVFMMTYAVFIVVQKIKVKASPGLSKMAALSYGVFLCHFVFVQLSYDLIYPAIEVPAFLKILLMAVFSFAVSLLLVWLLSLNKITRQVIM